MPLPVTRHKAAAARSAPDSGAGAGAEVTPGSAASAGSAPLAAFSGCRRRLDLPRRESRRAREGPDSALSSPSGPGSPAPAAPGTALPPSAPAPPPAPTAAPARPAAPQLPGPGPGAGAARKGLRPLPHARPAVSARASPARPRLTFTGAAPGMRAAAPGARGDLRRLGSARPGPARPGACGPARPGPPPARPRRARDRGWRTPCPCRARRCHSVPMVLAEERGGTRGGTPRPAAACSRAPPPPPPPAPSRSAAPGVRAGAGRAGGPPVRRARGGAGGAAAGAGGSAWGRGGRERAGSCRSVPFHAVRTAALPGSSGSSSVGRSPQRARPLKGREQGKGPQDGRQCSVCSGEQNKNGSCRPSAATPGVLTHGMVESFRMEKTPQIKRNH